MLSKEKTIEKAVQLLQEHADSIKECHTYPVNSENWQDEGAKEDYIQHIEVIDSLRELKF